jgi:hypothetical protein
MEHWWNDTGRGKLNSQYAKERESVFLSIASITPEISLKDSQASPARTSINSNIFTNIRKQYLKFQFLSR